MPLYADLVDIGRPSTRPAIDHRLKGEGNGFIGFLTSLETKQPDGTDRKGRPEEDRWYYLVVSSDIGGKHVKDQMRIANRLLQAFDGRLFQPRLAYSGVKMTEIAPEQKPRNMLEAMWLLVRNHPVHYLLTCKRCMRTVLSEPKGASVRSAAILVARPGAKNTRPESDSGRITAPSEIGAHTTKSTLERHPDTGCLFVR